MEIIRKYKLILLLALPLIIVAGVLIFFFFRLGSQDEQAITGFYNAYANFDQAMADFSQAIYYPTPETSAQIDELQNKADQALSQLIARSSARISSLTKNDGEIMQVMPEIADYAGRELGALKAYKTAVEGKSTDLTPLDQTVIDMSTKRQSLFSQFRILIGPR